MTGFDWIFVSQKSVSQGNLHKDIPVLTRQDLLLIAGVVLLLL